MHHSSQTRYQFIKFFPAPLEGRKKKKRKKKGEKREGENERKMGRKKGRVEKRER